MSRPRLVLLVLFSLLFAAVANAQSVFYEPPAPTTRDAITLWTSVSWAYRCDPDQYNVDVVDHAITVTIVAKKPGCAIGFPVITGWTGKKTIGPLAPGIYSVTTKVDGGSAIGTLEQPPLVVRDASGPLTVLTPDLTPSMSKVHLHTDFAITCLLGQVPCPTPVVRVGSVTATAVAMPTQNDIIATLPALQPGTYDVSMTLEGTTYTAVAALSVIDPAISAFQQKRTLERVLVPVVFSGPGAFGSQWTTEVSIVNSGDVPIDFYQSPFANGPMQPGETRTITTSTVGQQPNGFYLYVPRGEAKSVQFTALVRDLSKQSQALGTALPIVRESEFLYQPIQLMNVPSDPAYRVTLRAYTANLSPYFLRVYKMGEATPIINDAIGGFGGSSGGVIVADLVAKYPQLIGAGPLRVEIARQYGDGSPNDPGFWAFASVTNNDTQHVTLIAPE